MWLVGAPGGSKIPEPESIIAIADPTLTLDDRTRDAAPMLVGSLSHARSVGFDVVRAVAALGVIWVHVGRSSFWNDNNLLAAGAWGTAYLNVIAGFFVVRSLAKRNGPGVWAFLRHRVWRLYGAFLLWSLIYLAARLVNYAAFHKVSMIRPSWVLLFYGTTYHLWFLPYLVCVTLLTLPLVLLSLRSRNAMCVGAVFLMLAAAALLLLPVPGVLLYGGEFMLTMERLYTRSSGYLMGLALGLWVQAGFQPRVDPRQAWVCACIVAAAIYLTLASEFPAPILNRLAALAAFLVALAPWRGRAAELLGTLGQVGFGVYLCHVLIVEGLLASLTRMHIPSSFAVDMFVFAVTVVGSFTLALAMRRVRWLSWLVP